MDIKGAKRSHFVYQEKMEIELLSLVYANDIVVTGNYKDLGTLNYYFLGI